MTNNTIVIVEGPGSPEERHITFSNRENAARWAQLKYNRNEQWRQSLLSRSRARVPKENITIYLTSEAQEEIEEIERLAAEVYSQMVVRLPLPHKTTEEKLQNLRSRFEQAKLYVDQALKKAEALICRFEKQKTRRHNDNERV